MHIEGLASMKYFKCLVSGNDNDDNNITIEVVASSRISQGYSDIWWQSWS